MHAHSTPRIQPLRIQDALLQTMEREKKVLVFSVFVPDAYRVELSAEVMKRLNPLLPIMSEQLSEALEERIRRRKYRILSDKVRLCFAQLVAPRDESALFEVSASMEKAVGPSVASESPMEITPASGPCLIDHGAPGKPNRIPFDRDRFVLGRGDVDVVSPISDPCISRSHAEVVRAGEGRFSIRDLNSAIGTRVNGARIEEKTLEDGDIVDLGSWRLEFIGAPQTPATDQQS